MRRSSGVRLGPLAVCILVFTFALVASGTAAETVLEAWRSVLPAFVEPRSVSVNSTDGSCWVADAGEPTGSTHVRGAVVYLSAAGAELWRSATGAFSQPYSVSVNPADGSCWVADAGEWTGSTYVNDAVVHLSAAGVELWRSASGAFSHPYSVSVNSTDGSCWVADTYNAQVVHLSAAGAELWRSAHAFSYLRSVSVNPMDGSCWVADYSSYGQVVHLSAAGAVLWRSASGAFFDPWSVSVNPTDGSCWVANPEEFNGSNYVNGSVVHLSAAGAKLWRSASGAFSWPYSVSVNPTDDSCWVADYYNRRVVHLSATGAELWRSDRGAFYPLSVSVNPTDGSCWVANAGEWTSGTYVNSAVVHLSAAGAELWRSDSGAFSSPDSISVNSTDGSCWVTDASSNGQVVHLSAAGAKLWRSARGAFSYLSSVSVNPTDGSCWVADGDNDQLVHLSAAGAELWRSASGAFTSLSSVSVNPTDGSCWVGRYGQVVHLSATGAELWRSASGAFFRPYSVSVSPTDGSCWVADTLNSQVVHLSAAGAELWRSAGGGFSYLSSVSVNPTDGSCWVADSDEVVHLSATGAELWRSASGAFSYPDSVSVNPTDGSCWVADGVRVVYLSAAGAELWWSAGGAFSSPDSVSVNPTDGSCWVADTGHSQVVHLEVLGDIFADVNRYHWAQQQIEACAAAGIVGGYWDGTYRPELPVTRDAMAVYIARALAVGDALVPTGPATATFSDIPTSHWAHKYVEYAAAHGVVGGYWDETYRPTVTVTRDMMAVFVARAMCGGDTSVPTGPPTAFFSDVPTDHWAFRYVEYIRGEGVTGGYGDGTYRPALAVDRASMAVYVQRAFALPM